MIDSVSKTTVSVQRCHRGGRDHLYVYETHVRNQCRKTPTPHGFRYIEGVPSPRTNFVGYARVSTDEQEPAMQVDALGKAGCAKIFIERASGASAERPELDYLKDYLRSGDTLVVWRLDRLGRSLKDLIEIVNWLEERGVMFRSLTELIDTSTPGGKLIFHVFASLAEFERELIRERTRAGLAAARSRGRTGGRPTAMTPTKTAIAKEMIEKTGQDGRRIHSVSDVASVMNVSRATIYRALARAASE